MSLIIGLTGGIGSGKTTVANLFAAQGVDIIDADIVARNVVTIGSDGLNQIVTKFGNTILLEDGNLNRAALREKIFIDSTAKNWLESLLHPKIHQALVTDLTKATSPYCLLVAPLLLENNLQKLCKRILVVDVSKETQIARTCNRDKITHSQVKAILSAQFSRQKRLQFADDIVSNESEEALLDIQVKNLHAKYLSLSNYS